VAVVRTRLAAAVASSSNTTSYAGPVGTPAVGDLLLCVVAATGTTAAGTMSGGSLTWTQLTRFSYNSGADTMYVFWAVATAAVSITPTFDCTGDAATGAIIACARFTGLEGQNQLYVRQTATATGSTANPSIAFPVACNTNNAVILIGANGTNSATQWSPGTSYTEMDEATYTTPAASLAWHDRMSGETGNGKLMTNANTTPWGMIGIELYAAGQGPSTADAQGMGFFGGMSGP